MKTKNKLISLILGIIIISTPIKIFSATAQVFHIDDPVKQDNTQYQTFNNFDGSIKHAVKALKRVFYGNRKVWKTQKL